MAKKVQKDKQRSTKHTHKTKDRVTRTPLKCGGVCPAHSYLYTRSQFKLLTGMLKHSVTKDTLKIMMYRKLIEKMQSFVIEMINKMTTELLHYLLYR